jgi:hypothetical protein
MSYFLSTKKLLFSTIVVFYRTFTFTEQSFINLNLLFTASEGIERVIDTEQKLTGPLPTVIKKGRAGEVDFYGRIGVGVDIGIGKGSIIGFGHEKMNPLTRSKDRGFRPLA